MSALPMLSLSIPGKPIAFSRAARGKGHSYTPEPQASYQAAVGHIARAAMSKAGYAPFEGPVEVVYRATFAWPDSWSQKRRDKVRWKTSASDLDNSVKLAADAMSKIVYADDAQIVSIHATKMYGLPEGVVITITPLSECAA